MINYRGKERRLKLKREFVDRLGGKCIDCGYSAHLAALDFDHIDPSTKSFNIATALATKDYYIVRDEVDKCVLRCANCHRIRSHNEGHTTHRNKHRKVQE